MEDLQVKCKEEDEDWFKVKAMVRFVSVLVECLNADDKEGKLNAFICTGPLSYVSGYSKDLRCLLYHSFLCIQLSFIISTYEVINIWIFSVQDGISPSSCNFY